MAVSPEEALEAQEAAKANEGATDRGDDFTPTEDDEEVSDVRAEAEDGATDEPEVEAAAPDTDEVDETPEDDESDQRKPVLIPKHRYDSQAARTRAAEAEIAKLKEQLAERETPPQQEEAPTPDLDARLAELDDKVADAIADGDKDLAKKLMAESRAMEREFIAKQATQQAQNMSQQALEKDKLDKTIQMLEGEYDFFNPENEDKYNPELVKEVLDLHETFMGSGKYSPSDAMLQAVGYALKGVEVDAPKETTKRTRTKENIKDSKRQPPDMADTGVDADKSGKNREDVDVSKLSMEEFDALPDTTKQRLRGDFV